MLTIGVFNRGNYPGLCRGGSRAWIEKRNNDTDPDPEEDESQQKSCRRRLHRVYSEITRNLTGDGWNERSLRREVHSVGIPELLLRSAVQQR